MMEILLWIKDCLTCIIIHNLHFRCPCPGIYVFTWTARYPPKSETKIALFVNGKETGHQLWAAKSGKQSASQTAVSINPQVKHLFRIFIKNFLNQNFK